MLGTWKLKGHHIYNILGKLSIYLGKGRAWGISQLVRSSGER